MASCFSIFALAIILLFASCSQKGNAPIPGASDCNPCNMFLSASESDGNLGGPNGADTICANDANKPADGSIYKALISTQNLRRACTTDFCGTGGVSEHFDWVLKPNTIYQRVDGTVIGTTTSVGIFSFPITNAVTGAGSQDTWSGFQSQWDVSNINCNDWTSNGGINGLTGNSGNTSSSLIERGVQVSCGNPNLNIICVEQ